MRDTVRWTASGVFWTAALALMTAGTALTSWQVIAWGLFVGVTSSVLTAWIMTDLATHRERVHVDRVVEAVVDRILEERNLPHI